MGRSFLGCYDLLHDRLLLVERSRSKMGAEGESCSGIDDPKLDALLPADAVAKLREDVEMVRTLCPPFDMEAYLEGSMTPVYFGSALNNFGVRELLQGVADMATPPRPRPTERRQSKPTEDKGSGLVYKHQAKLRSEGDRDRKKG